MKTWMTLLFVWGLCGLLHASAPEVVSLPKNTPYADDSTGTVYPARIGSFLKTTVSKHLNPYYGTVIRYANEFGASADIYIYALDLKNERLSQSHWLAHYEEVKKNIPHLTGGSVPLGETVPVAEAELNLSEKSRKALSRDSSLVGKRCRFAFAIGEDLFFSELVIFPSGTKIIKLRVTYPQEMFSEKENAMNFIRHVSKEFFPDSEWGPEKELPKK